jgi:DNA invertase Pin-like site-specific DNA recombinase
MYQRLISYVRVSTDRQGKSGLGLEAQREAIARFAEKESATIVGEPFVEVETGKGSDALDRRPVVAAALALAKREKGAIVVAKLDRLSRDVAFIAALMAQTHKLVPSLARTIATASTALLILSRAATPRALISEPISPP